MFPTRVIRKVLAGWRRPAATATAATTTAAAATAAAAKDLPAQVADDCAFGAPQHRAGVLRRVAQPVAAGALTAVVVGGLTLSSASLTTVVVGQNGSGAGEAAAGEIMEPGEESDESIAEDSSLEYEAFEDSGPPPATSAFPRTASGKTYGSDAEAETYQDAPDLVAVISDDGVNGYVRKADLYPEEFIDTPEEAQAYENRTGPTVLDVFSLSGVVIGSFTIARGTSIEESTP